MVPTIEGALLEIWDACRRRGLRPTGPRLAVAKVFAETDDLLDVDTIWRRLNVEGASLSRTAIYRAVKDLSTAGAIRVHAVAGSGRTYFQKHTELPPISLVDVDQGDIIALNAPDLAARIGKAVKSAGYDLAGGMEVRVTRRR